ncbi:12401_t:CDS:2, partial [Entrophospora sp. SA101]
MKTLSTITSNKVIINNTYRKISSSASINKKKYGSIEFISLHSNIRTILPISPDKNNKLIPQSSLSPLSSTSTSPSSRQTLSLRPQTRKYSPQHFYHNRIIDQYVSQPLKTITMRQLVVFGRNLTEERLLKSGNYVRTELPVRLAYRIRDFQRLPFIVGTNPHIAEVYDLYWSAFEKLRKIPTIRTMDDNIEWCETIKGLLKEHLVVIPKLAMGINECSDHLPVDKLDKFMNTMLRSRISRRVLAEQQIALTENWHDPNYSYGQENYDGNIGIVSTRCNPRDIVERCAKMTRNLCRKAYGVEPPDIVIDDNGEDITFTYIPDHIEYILYELLKNSIRGVIESHKNTSSATDKSSSLTSYPPIKVTVCSNPTDVYFRVSDQGGGISDDLYLNIWSFSRKKSSSSSNDSMNSTVDSDEVNDRNNNNNTTTAPDVDKSNKFSNFQKVPKLAGKVDEYESLIIPPKLNLGIGLPMSKVYAEYWDGGLELVTMDGFGTDSYVKVSRLGNREENLE